MPAIPYRPIPCLAKRQGVIKTGWWPCYTIQGLFLLKLVAFGTCVNLTVGLPIIRTSVDHGTAFDIVGKGIADPGSLIEAITLAATLAKRR